MGANEKGSPKIVVRRENRAVVAYEKLLRSYSGTRGRTGGLKELIALRDEVNRRCVESGAERMFCWGRLGSSMGEKPLSQEHTYLLEPSLITESWDPFPLQQRADNSDLWEGTFGTVETSRLISLNIRRDFRVGAVDEGYGGVYTGHFELDPVIDYGGIADFGDGGSIEIGAFIQVQLLDMRYVNRQGEVISPCAVQRLWSSDGFAGPPVRVSNSGVTQIPSGGCSCPVSSGSGDPPAVWGTMIRVIQGINIFVNGAAVFLSVGMQTPTLHMWTINLPLALTPYPDLPFPGFFPGS